jgi:diaminohydroxyphosphoribosylaminopyrimidine deaminase/5-amino-6-(5-phosphoribosylamino)uracil reductase
MQCELPDDIAWPALLRARELLRDADELVFARRGAEWRCERVCDADLAGCSEVVHWPPAARAGASAPALAAPGDARCSVHATLADGSSSFTHPGERAADAGLLAMLRVYAPVLHGAAAAARAGRVFVVGHLTQTLDGRIACRDGRAQWFGNDADRRHAHRMRALLDAVMVGASTALADDPQLTVRAVPGPDPRRIVLSGCGSVLRAGRDLRAFAGDGCDVLVGEACDVAPRQHARTVRVAGPGASLAPPAILAALAQRGVRSVYLEGGARTLSSFLQAGCLDLLQVHIAPVVLGSGLAAFELPGIDAFADAHRFAMQHSTLGGDVLLSCWPKRRSSGA